MKTSNLEIKEHTFLNAWEIEYQVGRNYFIMCIDTEDLENVFEDEWNYEKYNSPQDFLETDEDIEKLLLWFHTEFADDVEPIDRNDSILYQYKIQGKKGLLPQNQMVDEKTQKVVFKSTFEKQNGLWQEVPTKEYLEAMAKRLLALEKETQEMKEEMKREDDILLTTDTIKYNYEISPQTTA